MKRIEITGRQEVIVKSRVDAMVNGKVNNTIYSNAALAIYWRDMPLLSSIRRDSRFGANQI